MTGVEERNVIDAVIEAGAKVYSWSPPWPRRPARERTSPPDGHLVIDIGGGTTEVAVVSLGGVVERESIKTAGDAFDEAIVRRAPQAQHPHRQAHGRGAQDRHRMPRPTRRSGHSEVKAAA
ncbi:MAG: rod shape-determining protein [Oscillospiraceae bacterium]